MLIFNKNGWNTQVLHILHEELDGKFIFKGNMLSRITKPVEISHEWVLKIFKYQDPAFCAILFDEPLKGTFEVPSGLIKVDVIIKSVPVASNLYVFQ